jgi:hypothetical protein
MVENPVAAYDHLVQGEPERPFTLRFELDGEVLTEQTYDLATYASRDADPFVAEHSIAPGAYHLRLAFVAEQTGETVTLVEETTEFTAGEIWRVVYEPRGSAKGR